MHRVVIGCTNSGKTSFAKYLYVNSRGIRIFYNTQLEKMPGEMVNDYSEILNVANEGKPKIVIVPPVDKEDNEEQLEKTVDLLFRISSKVKHGQRNEHWVTLFVDEAHLFSPKHSRDDALQKVARMGVGHGIYLVTISQRPANISHDVLTQAGETYVFKLTEWERPYMDKYFPNYDEYEEWLKKPYHFIRIDPDGEVTKMRPIPKRFAT